MKKWRPFRIAVPVLAIALGFAPQAAIGQQPAPPATKGTKIVKTTTVDLGPEIEGMEGRQLRMRVFTMEPGGEIALHNHKDRPGTVYVVHGTLTETRGDQVKEYRAGDTFSEGRDTTHTVQNKGTEPMTAIAVDIFKTQ
ncbi:MAG: cupin domain-containing protein [Pyrinomonadaceae bacterium]